MYKEAMGGTGEASVPYTGAQIQSTFGPVRFLSQMHRDIVKIDVTDAFLILSVNQDTVFAVAVDIFKCHIADMTKLCLFLALQRGDGDRFRLAPPVVGREKPGIDLKIGKNNVFDTAFVPQLHGDAAVASTDNTVLDRNIAE